MAEPPSDVIAPARPLQVAVLAKQIPVFEDMTLGPDGRIVRDGIETHMNDYCRRAVAKGTEIARASGGTVTVITLGPPTAENVCREALLFGVDSGIHICDPAFAGSDTWATAKALAAALERFGPFDLVMMGRNSVDADTGQVPPQLAEFLGLPFATGARHFGLDGERLVLRLEHDDEWVDVTVDLPAVVSCAERLCDPCKIKDPEAWATVDASLIETVSAAELGPGPWGEAASPTTVGHVRVVEVERRREMVSGTLDEQVETAMAVLAELGALDATSVADPDPVPITSVGGPPIAVLVEPGRERVTRELLGSAAHLAVELGGSTVALGPSLEEDLGPWGADEQISIDSSGGSDLVEEDLARAILGWATKVQPWAVLAPGTAWGREVASRLASSLGAGLTGDAVGLEVGENGRLKALKPAFGGWMVAEISYSSAVQMATVRPGVLPLLRARSGHPVRKSALTSPNLSRLEIHGRYRDDDSDELANATVVIGVGQGVSPDDYPELEKHRAAIGATLCATRKVTDYGWMPRARQVGITGHSISPRLYIAIGTSGKFNHTVGVRNAGTIVGINPDPYAPLWDVVDVGIIGDWSEVLNALIPHLANS